LTVNVTLFKNSSPASSKPPPITTTWGFSRLTRWAILIPNLFAAISNAAQAMSSLARAAIKTLFKSTLSGLEEVNL